MPTNQSQQYQSGQVPLQDSATCSYCGAQHSTQDNSMNSLQADPSNHNRQLCQTCKNKSGQY